MSFICKITIIIQKIIYIYKKIEITIYVFEMEFR